MSDQTYASPGDPYWLSSRGVDNVHFIKQANPPLAYADGRGALYELNDGILYFNGVPLSVVAGDVSSNSKPCRNLAIPVYDGTTGTAIKQSALSVVEPVDGFFYLNQEVITDGPQRVLAISFNTDSTALGTVAGPADFVTNSSASTFIGSAAGLSAISHQNSVYIGRWAGVGTTAGIKNTIVGSDAGSFNTAPYLTAFGCEAAQRNGLVHTTALGYASQLRMADITLAGIPNTSVGGLSLSRAEKGVGNNAVGYRALQSVDTPMTTGPRLNNAFGCFNGVIADNGFENNVMIGNSVLNAATTALGNVIVGNSAGEATGSGSNYNIYIGNGAGIGGLAVESRTIRIGASVDNLVYPYAIGKPTDCFIQGIHNRSPVPATERKMVAIDSAGKLYGCDLNTANPHGWGFYENYASPYSVPTISLGVPVAIAPALTFTTVGGYFTNPSPGILTYQGVDLVNAFVSVQMSMRSAVGTDTYDFSIYRAGVVVPGSTIRKKLHTATDWECCTISCMVANLSAGITIQAYATNTTGTNAAEIGNVSVSVQAKF